VSTATIKYGPITIHWYGIVVALAIVVAFVVSAFVARARGQRVEPLAGIVFLILLAGLIGARVWYYMFRRSWYSPDPGRIFAVWQGGMALHGALIGGVLAILIVTWNRGLDFWEWADICAAGAIVGQAIGRIGDVLNHQAFGPPTAGPLFVTIPPENRPPQYAAFAHFTPTAAYECIWDLVVFAVIVGLLVLQRWRPRLLPSGSVFLAYLVLYSLGRIPLEGLRVDSLWLGNLRVAQLASGLIIVVAATLYAMRLTRRVEPAVAPALAGPGQVTDAYLLAATRSSKLRLGHDPLEWDDLDNDDDDDDIGQGARNGRKGAVPADLQPAAAELQETVMSAPQAEDAS
jgi:phosphatidylglycerol:prolipoprotein diacylglycerol transferase